MNDAELLRVYDDEVRGQFGTYLPPGWIGERDGPLMRCLIGVDGRDGFAMLTDDASALQSDELASLVARTVAHFAERGVAFEWKTFDHERADLRPLLVAAGATAKPAEALVMGEVAVLAGPTVLPDGLTIRRVTAYEDLERVAALQAEVWAEDWSWLAPDLASRMGGDDPVHVFVVEHGQRAVSAGRLEPLPGSRIAGLWGGSTLPAYRGRGIYRALVAERARLAQALGFSLLQVDASDDSRPILVRLGLRVVGGTVPYEFPASTA